MELDNASIEEDSIPTDVYHIVSKKLSKKDQIELSKIYREAMDQLNYDERVKIALQKEKKKKCHSNI